MLFLHQVLVVAAVADKVVDKDKGPVDKHRGAVDNKQFVEDKLPVVEDIVVLALQHMCIVEDCNRELLQLLL